MTEKKKDDVDKTFDAFAFWGDDEAAKDGDSKRTDSAVGHGDRRARALLHQIHHLPEELAGVGGA